MVAWFWIFGITLVIALCAAMMLRGEDSHE